MSITYCTRGAIYWDFGRHFIFNGNKVIGARYCYHWQKCPRPVAPFVGIIMPMANGEWPMEKYAGLSLEEQMILMFGTTRKDAENNELLMLCQKLEDKEGSLLK